MRKAVDAFSLGPWDAKGPSTPTADTPEGGDYAIMDGGTNIIAEVFHRVSEGPGGTRPARVTAHLVAAAPDLLKALTNLANAFHEGRAEADAPGSAGYVGSLIDAAEDAITKATA